MSQSHHAMRDTVSLPLVDISGLRSIDEGARKEVADAIRQSCLDKGFMYVTGHGVPLALRQQVFAQSERFFMSSDEIKAAVDKRHSPHNRGYEPLRAQTLEPGMPPDLKEGFYIGRELAPDDPRVVAGKFNHGPNLWPEAMPEFKEVMQQYYGVMEELGGILMQGLARSLGLADNAFAGFCHEPHATLRLLHYPPQPANPLLNEKGCGAHTDFGGLTFLLQDEVGGLQVWDEQAGWIDAPPVEGSYVVNLGDMIARWTNDRYRSTLHRVINSSGRERYSVPFFYTGNPDYRVECLPTCLGDGETPRYPPTTVEGHLKEMYVRTYA